MTNQEKINLIGQKILFLSNNLDKYQAELNKNRAEIQSLKLQLEQLQLQEYGSIVQKSNIVPPQIIKIPEPEIEIEPVEIKNENIFTFPNFIVTENIEEDKIQEPFKNISVSQPKPIYQQPIVTPKPPRKKNELWEKLEKQFAENLTGILGSIILVIGVGFLGIYAALKVSATGRFLIISGFAAALVGIFFYLRKKEQWLKLASWLRSSAGAIFLFACGGANGIPGLIWTDNETITLLLLFFGIAVNLFLSYISGKQSFASLHVLLSLVSIIVMPVSPLTLIVGGVVTLFGVALTYREKRDYHLLFTISCFFAFHVFYWYSLHHDISQQESIIGIITILAVGLSVTFVHYRTIYTTTKFDRLPFAVHLINWLYFGSGLFLYSNGSKYSTFFLAAGSIAAFFLAKKAKKLEIRWLYLTDTLIGQLTAIIALATLYRWEVDAIVILSVVFVEGFLFLIVAMKENDQLLYKIGSVVLNVIGIVLLTYSLVTLDRSNQTLIINHSISVLGAAIIGVGYLIYSGKNNTLDIRSLFKPFNLPIGDKTKHPVLAIVTGCLLISYHLQVYNYNWSVYSVAALLVAILFLRHKFQTFELAFVSILLLAGSFIINWCRLNTNQHESPAQLAVIGLPLLLPALLSARWSFVKQRSIYFNLIGVYLIGIQLTLLSFYLLYPVSVLAPSAAWLVLALFAIMKVQFISKSTWEFHKADRYILHVGYALIALFLCRDVAVNISSEEIRGPLKGRVWVDFLAVFTFTYWSISKKRNTEIIGKISHVQDSSEYKSWKYLHPLLLELIVLFVVLTIAYEVNYIYLPIIWISTAFILSGLSVWKNTAMGRLNGYSFILYMIALFHEFSNYHSQADSVTATNQPFIVACIFIPVSISYLLFFFKYTDVQNVNWPAPLNFMKPITESLIKSAAFTGVYLYSIFLLLISYYMFASISVIIPGVVWLLLSVVMVTLSFYAQKATLKITEVDRYLLHSGYLLIAAFLIRHLLVHIQLEGYVGPVKIRLLIEVLALMVFVYWATLKPKVVGYKSWDYLHPLFIELIFIFSVCTIALEVDAIWQPVIWILIAFALSIIGNYKREALSRLLFYSLVMYWIAAFQTTFVTSTYIVPSAELINQPWVYGTASVLLQFGFLTYFYLKCSLENIAVPKSIQFLQKIIYVINKKRNVYVFYPLIICTAVFLFWSFDRSILTLLWVVECAIVFVISILLKEQHFRYISLGCLALCIIRLVFYDMAQASTLNRALVFLGVGIIMLGMNTLYNKYKDRFE